ncbi:MAG TPA: molybdate ABC transporter substrate-binding protein [Silvibacterium sp.]|nr:molybdate ABC transporter substrate-binding protein [Silvibacterium sp.]
MSDLRRALGLAILILTVIAVPALGSGAQTASAARETLRIAAAADLQPVLPPLLAEFETQTGIHTEASYQSSATLATQIINGAPFDLFLAADLSFPDRVIAAGLSEETQPIAYARGTLVLWARNDSTFHSLSMDCLKDPELKSLAMADPEHAPYGRAAKAALIHLGLYDSLKSKLVIAENIAQAAQFVESGNAELGLISLTSAVTPRLRSSGHYVPVPQDAYPPILQGAVIVKHPSGTRSAHRFLDFLASASVQQQLEAAGLAPAK